MQRRLAKIDPTKALREPTVIVYEGCLAAFDQYLEKLVTAIGPECHWSSEEEFCSHMGCAPENLEDWLSRDWVQHYPHLVLALEDVPGPFAWVLYRVGGREQQVRVFSASPELAEWMGKSGPRAPDLQEPRGSQRVSQRMTGNKELHPPNLDPP